MSKEEHYLRSMEDEATLYHNAWQQTWELKALDRRTGKDALKSYPYQVTDPAMQVNERWNLLEDLNASLNQWGWRALNRNDWHGTRATGWAAKLVPAD
ncbi:MAG: hypothetical protein KIT89_04440 [Microcella sp.]|uniref:hypothetical protein n=1 Tax=Microcella sp. TaxID=1913979 RepID=UPI0024CD4535|nr:hypothetical protein [Microcella sp.]UYN84446.1 MAG: hypothetical protein KIT89_04440 [Microcella sp.]